MKTFNKIRTRAILDSLIDNEIETLMNIATGRSLFGSDELTVLRNNYLICLNAQESGHRLSAEGHRVIALAVKEMFGFDPRKQLYDQFMIEATECAERVFEMKVTFDRDSLWRLRQSGSNQDFAGAVFETQNGRTGTFHTWGERQFDVLLNLESE